MSEKDTTPPVPGAAQTGGDHPRPDAATAGAGTSEPPTAKVGSDDPAGEDFATLFASSESAAGKGRIGVGDLVTGRVVVISRTSAFVTIGAKGEAEIDLAEFRDSVTGEVKLQVGDQVVATVVDDGSTSGSIVLKQTLGRGSHLPAELEQALEHGIAVEGLVTGENKGGFDVQIGGARAFCPGSQIDLRRGQRVPAATYVGQRLRFRVIKIESGGRNVVVSRRQLLEEETRQQASETWQRLEVGAVVSGTVSSLRDFGAFVDLGGVEGLIHIAELGYGRVGHPSEVLSEGQVVEAQIIKLERPEHAADRGQVGLSLKALAADPWDTVAERFPVGTTLPGTVRRLENFGAFVEIAPGLDGLVHVSKMVLDRRISHPRQVVSSGDAVEVTVVSVDAKQRRLSLSMVERARQTREATEARDQSDQQALLANQNTPHSLGTLGDILAASRKKRQ